MDTITKASYGRTLIRRRSTDFISTIYYLSPKIWHTALENLFGLKAELLINDLKMQTRV